MHRANAVVCLMLLSILGCQQAAQDPKTNTINMTSLSALQQLSTTEVQQKKANKNTSHLRQQALSDTAMSLGAQAGLAFRAEQIHGILKHLEPTLERVFNFQPMMLAHNIVPPVLQGSEGNVHIDSDEVLRLADRSYRVMQQARFTSHVPHWRDYLQLSYKNPEKPDQSLLPRNSKEKTLWRDNVAKGWRHGIVQADTIFKDKVAKLTQHYKGMVLYRKLLAQNMVSTPFVAKTRLGVTGSDSELRINDTVLRIASLPSMITNSQQWQPAL